ncbi:hypothetical protein BBI01_04435 [Chryseobacterium artocarpi]|uniref:Uncharacterized protein n=2 Tax=Chryseobacterium artocarpi TaxID=1414727 RepID=A0A1B8ZWI5_9FLAO|nr:hypothetical protein BBI01_04435 [Chryseobacterium artocarpi]
MIMKKILLSIFAISSFGLYAQKTIHVFNYTNFNLVNTLLGADQSNSNCFPSIQGTNYPIPVAPQGTVTYKSYRHSDTKVPPINSWTVTSGINIVNTLAAADPQLDNLGIVTDWMLNKFYVADPGGGPLLNSGASIGTIGCNGQLVTHLQNTSSTPYAFNDAFWFVSAGETYFVIQ